MRFWYLLCVAAEKAQMSLHIPCGDPESFVRGGPTLTVFFFYIDEGMEDLNTTISRPSLAHQRNAIKMVFYLRANDGPPY